MKKLFVILVIAIMLASCATETDITEKNADGSPIWTTEVPQSNKYVYGVGSAKLSNQQNSRTAADANARADLSRKLQVMLNDAVSVYSNDSEGSVLAAYEQITVQTVSMSIRGIKTEQSWTAPDGTVWTIVSVRTKNLDKTYELEANQYLNKLEKDKLVLQEKYLSLMADIVADEEKNEATDAVSAAVDSYYQRENEKLNEILDSISPEELAKAVAATLISNGYDLT